MQGNYIMLLLLELAVPTIGAVDDD